MIRFATFLLMVLTAFLSILTTANFTHAEVLVIERGKKITLKGQVTEVAMNRLKIKSSGREIYIDINPMTQESDLSGIYKVGAYITVEGTVTEDVNIPRIQADSIASAETTDEADDILSGAKIRNSRSTSAADSALDILGSQNGNQPVSGISSDSSASSGPSFDERILRNRSRSRAALGGE